MQDYIDYARIALLILFNSGITARILFIIVSALSNEDAFPKKKVVNHIIAAIIVNIAVVLVDLFQNYYSFI